MIGWFDPLLRIMRLFWLHPLDADWSGRPRGAYVLYLQVGPRFVERGTWPITEKTQRILAELAEDVAPAPTIR